jgi:tRNA threonylcarbamoyladenosine biosynthesis protein TsaE
MNAINKIGSENFKNSFLCNSLNDLKEVAIAIISQHESSRIFAFYGEMGAGKTTLIQRLCDYLGVTDVVSSPTFALINEYLTQEMESIYHFDFYRMEKLEEVYDIGYEDYFYSGNYCFIEWPGKIESLLPVETIPIRIIVDPNTDLRTIYF